MFEGCRQVRLILVGDPVLALRMTLYHIYLLVQPRRPFNGSPTNLLVFCAMSCAMSVAPGTCRLPLEADV